MAGFDPRGYNDDQPSRFSVSGTGTAGTGKAGSFGQYLGGGNTEAGSFGAQMQSTFAPPSTGKRQEQQAYGDQVSNQNTAIWGDGLNRNSQQFSQAASIGNSGLSGKQQWIQAKQSAQQAKAASTQGAIFGGISSGLSLLGGISSVGAKAAPKSSGPAYSFPSESSWSMKGMGFG
jgi:hypothetical protein